jgi:three-Cys-motif partner protein
VAFAEPAVELGGVFELLAAGQGTLEIDQADNLCRQSIKGPSAKLGDSWQRIQIYFLNWPHYAGAIGRSKKSMRKSNEDFWDDLEDWSRRKHLILKHYLPPATAKLRSVSQDKRVVIIDAFAGRGEYEDGAPGSPKHMCELADLCQQWQNPVRLEIYNTEPDPKNFEELRRVTSKWENANIVTNLNGTFQQYLPSILTAAGRSSIVAFLDPFRPSQLLFEDFTPILNRETPTDILIVFMTPAIQRIIRAAAPDSKTDEKTKESNVDFLNGVFGGENWHYLLNKNPLDPEAVVECFTNSLLHRAAPGNQVYVCSSSITRDYKKDLKYHVVLFTRHIDGALLINDAFCKEQRDLYALHLQRQPTLGMDAISSAPNVELTDAERRERLVGSLLQIGRANPKAKWKRKDLINENLFRNFGEYTRTEHRGAIEALAALNSHPRIISPRTKAGRPRMNEDTEIWFEF